MKKLQEWIDNLIISLDDSWGFPEMFIPFPSYLESELKQGLKEDFENFKMVCYDEPGKSISQVYLQIEGHDDNTIYVGINSDSFSEDIENYFNLNLSILKEKVFKSMKREVL